MRTFLVNANKNSKNYKKPLINWGSLNLNTEFKGNLPNGYNLAINPTPGIIIVDVDVDDEKNKNGFKNIPGYYQGNSIFEELCETYHYPTKRCGQHFWLKYTGNKNLLNSASNQSIDLRIGPTIINNEIVNNGGYAIYYPAINGDNINNHLSEIKETSLMLNEWIEKLFC